jgi:hypothetical protein
MIEDMRVRGFTEKMRGDARYAQADAAGAGDEPGLRHVERSLNRGPIIGNGLTNNRLFPI